MSILIRGMEMPTSCEDCKAFVCYRQYAGDSGDCFCGITKSDAKVGARNADCPLVAVPPHGRLIDADALREDWLENGENEYVYDTNAFLDSLDKATTVIEAEEGET